MEQEEITREVFRSDDGFCGIQDTVTGEVLLPPTYEWIGELDDETTWIKRKEGYGLLDCNTFKEVIPCQYANALYPDKLNQIIVWRDYKAGLIDMRQHTIIPIAYDALELVNGEFYHGERGDQHYWFDSKGYPIQETKELAAFIQPQWAGEEELLLQCSLHELEERIISAYQCYVSSRAKEDYKETKRLIEIRQFRMNKEWKHNTANVARIERVNNLLNDNIKEAVVTGQHMAESLAWMEQSADRSYCVDIRIYPCWANDRSEIGYQPLLEGEAEEERLCDQELDESGCHLWNIIRKIGKYETNDRLGHFCFFISRNTAEPECWAFEHCLCEDGQSYDQGLHRPIYQDIHFCWSWERLCWSNFNYALEDLARMNEFKIEIQVLIDKVGSHD